jgi:hypothetical protein
MTLREFMDRVRDLPADTVLCVAEVDETFAVVAGGVEVVDDARTIEDDDEDPGDVAGDVEDVDILETVELANGDRTVVVIRW